MQITDVQPIKSPKVIRKLKFSRQKRVYTKLRNEEILILSDFYSEVDYFTIF